MMSTYNFSSFLLLLVFNILLSARGVMMAVNILATNLQLPMNSYLRAADYYLLMQNDCDLVLYQGTQAMYRSGSAITEGSNCSGLAMQTDGNLVVYDGSTIKSNALWAAGSTQPNITRKFSYYLLLQSTGNLSLNDATVQNFAPLPWPNFLTKVGADFQQPANLSGIIADPQFAWKPPSLSMVHSFMFIGYYLAESMVFASINGQFAVTLQNDCNVQVKNEKAGLKGVVWETRTGAFASQSPCQLTLQEDGRLVILGKSAQLVWNSSKSGKTSANWVLTVDDEDGHLTVMDLLHQETILWTTLPPALIPNLTSSIAPSPTASIDGQMQPAARMESAAKSVVFRATVGALSGAIFLLSMVIVGLVLKRMKNSAVVQAQNAFHRRDENNSWERSTFAGQDSQTSTQEFF